MRKFVYLLFFSFVVFSASFVSCKQTLIAESDKDLIPSRAVYSPVLAPVQSFNVGDYIYLKCEGTVEGPRWLNGLTYANDVNLVNYTGDNNTGAKWKVIQGTYPGTYVFQTQGEVPGNTYLDGLTYSSDVALARYYSGVYTGTIWTPIALGNGLYAFKCGGTAAGNKYLDGRTHNGTVGLSQYYGGAYSGAVWSIWEEQ